MPAIIVAVLCLQAFVCLGVNAAPGASPVAKDTVKVDSVLKVKVDSVLKVKVDTIMTSEWGQ